MVKGEPEPLSPSEKALIPKGLRGPKRPPIENVKLIRGKKQLSFNIINITLCTSHLLRRGGLRG